MSRSALFMSADCPLSERELEVLRLVATGATNQQIARALIISPNTVKVHLRNIFEKLQVASRTEATMLAVQAGWLTLDGIRPAVEARPTPAVEPEELRLESAPTPMLRPSPRLELWQRVYLILVISVTVLAIFWPLARSANSRIELGPFSDVGRPALGPAPWADVSRWTVLAPLPQPRARLALASYKGRLYAIGGEGTEGVSGAVYVFDPVANAWSPRARKPTPVSNFGVAVLGDVLYAVGGCTADGGVTDVVEMYDPAQDIWRAAKPMLAPRCAHAVAALGDRLYVFGGWDGSRYVADVFIYDRATDAWERGASMPVARGFLGAAALRDHIYVVGGFDGRREYALAHRYNPAAEAQGALAWEALPPMMRARGGLGVAAEGNAIYAIGGGWRGDLEYNERFDLLSSTWSRVESPFKVQWRNAGVATLDTRVYVVGGWSGDYLNAVAAYQASFRAFLPLGGINTAP
ncbi:MAG: LuxR C-terminal-related transcriptional regulator [Anaerolineae bacterium]|nr:LuxR C-terminal-related transcriptional regulator [Anaerolineae bacterium]